MNRYDIAQGEYLLHLEQWLQGCGCWTCETEDRMEHRLDHELDREPEYPPGTMPRERALDIPTLVDCGCSTVVYQDGSGVEIEYCSTHAAAPDLLEACKVAVDYLEGKRTNATVWNTLLAAIDKAIGLGQGG